MPVQAGQLDRREVEGAVGTAPAVPHQHRQNHDTDDHVQRVHAGHHEVETEEKLCLARARSLPVKIYSGYVGVVKLVEVFDRLDPEEDTTEYDRQEQKQSQQLPFAEL